MDDNSLFSFYIEETKVDKLLSFVDTPPFVDPFAEADELIEIDPEKNTIWDKLLEIVIKQVKKDGINEDAILPEQIESEVFGDAVSHIYHDVTEFYAWYFNKDDDRSFFLKSQKPSDTDASLEDAVRAVVDDNLDAMREVGEIPAGLDVDGLDDTLVSALSRYVVNWQDWYYDRKKEEEIDNYFDQASFYDEIYIDGNNDDGTSYGDLSNILDTNQFDRVSDVPYLSKELETEDVINF